MFTPTAMSIGKRHREQRCKKTICLLRRYQFSAKLYTTNIERASFIFVYHIVPFFLSGSIHIGCVNFFYQQITHAKPYEQEEEERKKVGSKISLYSVENSIQREMLHEAEARQSPEQKRERKWQINRIATREKRTTTITVAGIQKHDFNRITDRMPYEQHYGPKTMRTNRKKNQKHMHCK